jgi:hypothetical protein
MKKVAVFILVMALLIVTVMPALAGGLDPQDPAGICQTMLGGLFHNQGACVSWFKSDSNLEWYCTVPGISLLWENKGQCVSW